MFCTNIQSKLLLIQHWGTDRSSRQQLLYSPTFQQISCTPCGYLESSMIWANVMSRWNKSFGTWHTYTRAQVCSLPATCIPHSRMLDKEFLLSANHFSWQHWFWCQEFTVLPEASFTLNLLTTQALHSLLWVTFSNQTTLRGFFSCLLQTGCFFNFIPSMLCSILMGIPLRCFIFCSTSKSRINDQKDWHVSWKKCL